MKLKSKYNFLKVIIYIFLIYKSVYSDIVKINEINVLTPDEKQILTSNFSNIYNISKNNLILDAIFKNELNVNLKDLKKIKLTSLEKLPVGNYLAINNSTNKFFIVSDYKIIYEIINNNLSLWIADYITGLSYKKYEVYTPSGKLKQKRDYFYELNLDKETILVTKKSNSYNFIKVTPSFFQLTNKTFVKIIPEKNYYYIGEFIKFIFILRIKNGEEFILPEATADIKIEILNNQNVVIFEKRIKNISQSLYKIDDIIIDEKFKEGIYKIKIYYKNITDEVPIVILAPYKCNIKFKNNIKKEVFNFNEKIKFTVYLSDKIGNTIKDGIVNCEIWAKDLNFDEYHFITKIKKPVRRGKVSFKFKPYKFLKPYKNYDLKFIYKYRGNNGIIEANYLKVKVISSDISLKIVTSKNIYEKDKEEQIQILYEIEKINPYTEIKNRELLIYKKLNETEKVIYKKSFNSNKDKLNFSIKEEGVYYAILKVRTKKYLFTKSAKFYVISKKISNIIENFDKIIIIPNKNEYEYSDIASALVILPFRDLWVNFKIIKDKVYWNELLNAKIESFLYYFPISESYAPYSYLNVTFLKDNKIFNEKVKINVPNISKIMKLSEELEDNELKIECFNIWGHKIESDIITTTLNYDFVELYNYNNVNLYKLFYENEAANNRKLINNEWLFFHSDYLDISSINFDLLHYDGKTNTILRFEYPDINSRWVTILQGVTPDSKTAIKKIYHSYNKKFDVKLNYPEFLTINDSVYINFFLENLNISSFKSQKLFELQINNGKYLTSIKEFIKNDNISIYFKPKSKVTTKFSVKVCSPFSNYTNVFYIPVILPEKKLHSKNDFIKVKKRFYKLKYIETKNNYYSKPKSIGKKFNVGDEILVEIYIKSKEPFFNININDFLPAGCKYVAIENYKYKFVKVKSKLNYIVKNDLNKIVFTIPYLPKGKNYLYYIIKPYLKGKFYTEDLKLITNLGTYQYNTACYIKIK